MKSSFSLALFAMMLFVMGVATSCGTPPQPVDENGDDDIDSVVNNSDEAFSEAFGDNHDIEAAPPNSNMDDMLNDDDMGSDVKDPIEDTPKETPKVEDENTVGIERYNQYWSKNMDPNYPSSRYLIGIGSVHYDTEADKTQARHRAAADGRNQIAAFFKAKISSLVKSEAEKIVTIKEKARQASTYIKDEYDMSQSVNQTVKGAEVKGYAYDNKLNLVHSLVVLDKKKAAEQINEDLKSIKSTIGGHVSNYQTAYSEGKVFRATEFLAKAINMIIKFRAKRKEAIFIAPEGFDIIDLDGIEEGGLIQKLSEITIEMTLMIKSMVKTTDENGVTKVLTINSVASGVAKQLRKSNTMIMLKNASAKLKSSSFEDVSSWGVEELQKAAPDTRLIILANLEAEIVDQTELNGTAVYTAKTTFSVQMIDITTGEIVHSIDSAEHNLYQGTKAMLGQPKSALNASIGNAAQLIAKQIFSFLNP